MDQRPKGFHTMSRERAHTLSRRGTQTVVERANDYSQTYAPYIRAAVREVGQNYRRSLIGLRGSASQLSEMAAGQRRV